MTIGLTLLVDRADGNAFRVWPLLCGCGISGRYAHRACLGIAPRGCLREIVGVDRGAGAVESEARRTPVPSVPGPSFAAVEDELTGSLARTALRTELTALR